MHGAPPDPIVRVRARPVPGLAVEGPIIFMPRPVHRVEPAAQLVPKQEQPVGMVIEQFAELLHGRVVDDAHDRTMLALSVQRETTEREIETLTETKTTLQAAVDTLRAAAAKV